MVHRMPTNARKGIDNPTTCGLPPECESLSCRMSTAVDAIYEKGFLQLLSPLPLPEHSRVRVAVELIEEDSERAEWQAQSQRRLQGVWDNDADDVFNELLTP
jgi:predicted DNA-binding antitoxin AbrB/MazE fold protein